MEPCPRCHRANAVARESDRWGEYDSCWTCGWTGEVVIGLPLEYTPWNRQREDNDPVETAEKIERAKAARQRDPERVKQYNRTYKAKVRAIRRAQRRVAAQ